MNHQLIRSLDAWAGLLVCFLLSMHRKILRRATTPSDKPKNIMFIKLIEQGASVLAMPAFDRAAAMVGRQHVYICVFTENRPIVDALAPCPPENVWTIRSDNILLFGLDLIGVLRRARRVGIEATVDMEFFSRASAMIAYLMGAKRRVGLHRFTMAAPYRGDLMTHRFSYNPHLHTSQTYLCMVEALSGSGSSELINKMPVPQLGTSPTFTPTTDDLTTTLALLEERLGKPLPSGPRLILNPNASDLMPLRKWPTPRFIELAQRLLKAYPDASVILTGAGRERAETERLCAALKSPRLVTVAGATSLRQLLTMFTLCDVLVTNDSGPAHFASLTNIHNIVLFGPETPRLYGPIGGQAHTLSGQLACSPCINALNHRLSPCTNNVCMQSISVQQVFDEVASCLRSKDQQLSRPA